MNQACPSPHYSILIVEDERAIAENIFFTLEAEGYSADMASHVRHAKVLLDTHRYDAVVLDIGLADGDGYALLEFMRGQRQLAVPVLVLTARASLDDKIQGFQAGADDYLTKPFALQELVLRIHALIRRSKQLSDTAHRLRHGPIEYVPASQQAFLDGVELKLTRKSLLILELLLRYGTRVVPREKLEEWIWQGEPPSVEALRSQLHLLRKALNMDGIDWIETVHGFGWRLQSPSQVARWPTQDMP